MLHEYPMKIKISNKLFFYTMGSINLIMIIALIMVIILIISSGRRYAGNWFYLRILGILPAIIMLVISRLIVPSYFESTIQPNELRIRYFKPDGSNILQFIFLLFYLGNLKEHILTRRSYNKNFRKN